MEEAFIFSIEESLKNLRFTLKNLHFYIKTALKTHAVTVAVGVSRVPKPRVKVIPATIVRDLSIAGMYIHSREREREIYQSPACIYKADIIEHVHVYMQADGVVVGLEIFDRAAKFIVFNTKFLVFDTKFLVFNAEFLVFNAEFIIFTHICMGMRRSGVLFLLLYNQQFFKIGNQDSSNRKSVNQDS